MRKPQWLTLPVIIAGLLAIGIFFRFYHLDHKVYWYDETQTSLRLSGHTQTDLEQQVFQGQVISVAELHRRYQYPNSDRSLPDVMRSLAGNPEHSPLYFLWARGWLQTFGPSIAVIRSLSAWLSVLALPLTYWLVMEWIQNRSVAWMAVFLTAVSPFHVLYAQEAREYSLWIVTVLLSSALFLRSLRQPTWINWLLYGISVALGLYTHPFSAFVSVSHGLYLLGLRGQWILSQGRLLAAYGLASAIGLSLFSPWLGVILQNFAKFTGNTASVGNSLADLEQRWLLNLSRIFFDVNQGPSWINPIAYLLLALVIYAIYRLCRDTPPRVWLFVISLMGVLGLALLVPDVLWGGRRSNNIRYIVPCVIGIQLAVAYWLQAALDPPKSPLVRETLSQVFFWIRRTLNPINPIPPFLRGARGDLPPATPNPSHPVGNRRRITIALLLAGILSCAISSQAEVWWHKSYAKSRLNPQVAAIVNRSGDRPLVISDEIPGQVLSFSHLLHPQVRLQLVQEPAIPNLSRQESLVFLYRPSDNLRQGLLAQQLQLQPVGQTWLWQVSQTSAPSRDSNMAQ